MMGFMKLRSRRWFVLCTLALVIALVTTACVRSPFWRPAPRGTPAASEPTINLKIAETGQIRTLKMEEYIQGVVAQEMDPTWPVEALAAQAILARTFTVEKIAEGKQPSTDEKEFQAYNAAKINDNVRRAVEISRGQVITFGGKTAEAFFHSSAGGKTATALEGLSFDKEPTPYLKVVNDPPGEEKKFWEATFTRDEIISGAKSAGLTLANFTSAKIGAKGPSGRATSIFFGNTPVPAVALRLALGSEKMKSTMLTEIGVSGNSVKMKGVGFGHGVGMSQFGAKALAKAGKPPADIINYYFSGVAIEKRWR